tara:strand:- start:3065 stop:3805 length:741 start_codon:yes stop_codon:yes gene_type:complete
MNYNLENKKVLITGATGGIGKELCKKFLKNGCKIICTSTSKEKIEKLKNELGSSQNFYLIDFSDEMNISKNLNSIIEEHKNIDILINNAGITDDNLFLRMKDNQWNEVLKINLNSNFYTIKAILPSMIKNRSGSIIGISSVVAHTGNPGQANYTASKGAIGSMYKSLAIEVAQRNIRVNLIAPGFIKTPMTEKMSEVQVNSILNKIPMNRLGEARDVANMAAFLSTDEASYITGQTFHINGGMLMV